ncbi:MAG: hypothetical protein GY861_21155 [bacterium]|nr:hypothetical protein [bacterium]
MDDNVMESILKDIVRLNPGHQFLVITHYQRRLNMHEYPVYDMKELQKGK